MTMKLLSLFILISFITSSCSGKNSIFSDLFTTNKKEASIGNILGASCELDVDAFSHILDQNIKGDILCLENKLNLFMKLVKTDRPGFISKTVLKDFLATGPIDIGEGQDINPIIDSVFDLGYLLFGGSRGYISETDVKSTIDLLIYFNQHIFWKVNKYFTSPDTVNYQRHEDERQEIYEEFVLISKEVNRILKTNRNGEIHRINTEEFLANFFGSKPETYNSITSLMMLKKIFLGGERFDLTHKELQNAVYKLPELALVAFDVVKAKKFNFSDDVRKMFKLYNKDVDIMRSNLYYGSDDNISLFTIYDVFTALENVLEGEPNPDELDLYDIRKYPREIIEVKNILLKSRTENGKHFTSNELGVLFGHMKYIFDAAEYFYRMYEEYREDLDLNIPVAIDFSGFPAHTDREQEFKDTFTTIAYNYRFMKGNQKAPYFSFNYERNPTAMVEIGAYEYLVKIIMKSYGRVNEKARGGYDMTLDDHVMPLIEKIKRPLKDLGLTTIGRVGGGEATAIGENLVLMSTLFQNQSDGCDKEKVCMETPELTEFIVGLMTAMSIKSFFSDEMKKRCGDNVDEYGRFQVSCFRENFVNVLKTPIPGDGQSLADYMPLLYSYIQDLTKDVPDGESPTLSESYNFFLSETEAFTRTCTHYDEHTTMQESIPMKDKDAFGVFAGLLNVESTLIRFDKNENNKMDGDKNNNEVLNAYYEVYEGAIKGLVAPNGGLMEKLAKSIFQYLVKYGKVPDTKDFNSLWDYAKFLIKINKRADASRTTIATILKTLGNESDNAKEHPFKCDECLRDPTTECVPEGPGADTWDYDWTTEEFRN